MSLPAYDPAVANKTNFVLSLLTQDSDYQVEQAASAEEAARNLGVGLRVIYADNDSILQSQQILRFIQCEPELRPDGIIVEPVGGTGLPQVAKATVESGVGWVVLNCEVAYVKQLRQSSSAPVFAVAADNQEVGHIQARQFAAMLPEGGSVLYIQGPSDTDTAKLRMAGMACWSRSRMRSRSKPSKRNGQKPAPTRPSPAGCNLAHRKGRKLI